MSTFSLERIAEPAVEPITLAEMKRHLRLWTDVTNADDDVEALITSTRQWAEDYTSCALIDQTWRLNVHYLESCSTSIMLHRAPVLEVTSFVHIDDEDVETAMNYEGSPALPNWELREQDSKWPRVAQLYDATWYTGRHRIEFRAGYADRSGSPAQGAEVVPAAFLQAMKLYATALWDRDKDMMPKLIEAAERLLDPLRLEAGFV